MPASPRALLAQLSSGEPLPAFPEEAVARARTLAAAPAEASREDVEALPEPLALAVLEASVRARTPALPAALAGSPRKELARAARKALYQLRSAGVAIPEAAPVSAPAPTAAAAAAESLPAVVTAMEGNGDAALLLARPVRGRAEALQFLLNDEAGVVEVSRLDLTRAGYLKLLGQLQRDQKLATVELSNAEALEEVAVAAGRNLTSRTPFPQGLETVLRHLEVQPRQAEEPLPPPTPEDVRLSVGAHALHEQPELAGWLPPADELRVLAQRLDQVDASPLALSDVQRTQQLLDTARAQAHAFFTEPMRRLYARRLWWMARLFERTDRAPTAEVARAEARRLFHGALDPYPRFAEALFEKVLRLHPAAVPAPGGTGGTAPAAGGQPPAPSAGGPEERRSPGGIILP